MAYLLLHGLGSDRDQPLSLVGPCLPEGARVLAPDLRAHGESALLGGPRDFAFDAITAELVDTVTAQGFDDEPLTVIGISLGAAMMAVGTASGRSSGSKARLRGNSTRRMARVAASGFLNCSILPAAPSTDSTLMLR
jgi:pimeloyl-ACP methyl ester carboxylesterase